MEEKINIGELLFKGEPINSAFKAKYNETSYLITTAHGALDGNILDYKIIIDGKEYNFKGRRIKRKHIRKKTENKNQELLDYLVIPIDQDEGGFELDKSFKISNKLTLKPSQENKIDWELVNSEFGILTHEYFSPQGNSVFHNLGEATGVNKKGYSGSPVFNDKHELIGLNIAGREDGKSNNHFIKISDLLNEMIFR
ncbi:MAG: hypothetical protein RJQ00_07270 [Vicingaceae bacterium]